MEVERIHFHAFSFFPNTFSCPSLLNKFLSFCLCAFVPSCLSPLYLLPLCLLPLCLLPLACYRLCPSVPLPSCAFSMNPATEYKFNYRCVALLYFLFFVEHRSFEWAFNQQVTTPARAQCNQHQQRRRSRRIMLSAKVFHGIACYIITCTFGTLLNMAHVAPHKSLATYTCDRMGYWIKNGAAFLC